MAISAERAKQHVDEHCARLSAYPRNRNWPRYLFHTAQLEVVDQILRTGKLIPRKQQSEILHDVANPGAVANNPNAHQYVRFYFRPKTGFHLRTEGIKCLGDPNRLPRQMSVPIMLVFGSEALLCQDGVGFTTGNLASQYSTPGFDEEFFDSIPFNLVYHDQALPQERIREVHFHRMAEVVYPGELQLNGKLKRIVCRTPFDRISLLSGLGDIAQNYKDLVTVEQIFGSSFFHWGLYIKSLKVVENTLYFSVHIPRVKPASQKYSIEVRQIVAGEVVYRSAGHVDDSAWRIQVGPFEGQTNSTWEIYLEGVIAFKGPVPTGKSQIF